jgi:hypothetical protein
VEYAGDKYARILIIAIEIRFGNLQGYPVSSNEKLLTSIKGMLTLKQVLVQVSFLLSHVKYLPAMASKRGKRNEMGKTKKKETELIQRRG